MAQVFQIVIFVAQKNAHFDPQKGPLKGDKKIIKLLACILLSILGGGALAEWALVQNAKFC